MTEPEQVQIADKERLENEADPNRTKEIKGLEFLEEIEAKHNRVLTELDDLNERIEKVLDEYLKSRKAPQSDGAEEISPKSEAA